jgi:esterase/lipase superfamily enzyme
VCGSLGVSVARHNLISAFALLCGCVLIGSVAKLKAEDRTPFLSNNLQQLAQLKPRAEPEAKNKDAPRSDAAKRQALLKRRVEQLRKAGKHAAAIPTAQRSLALAEQRHGREHPSVAMALTTLGGLYAREHRYSEAEQAYKRALGIREKSLGPDHPDTVASINNLAGLYQEQGNHNLAEQYYKRALAIQEKSLASNPSSAPDVATTLSNLASVYQSQGRAAEAAQLTEQARALRASTAKLNASESPLPKFRAERRIVGGEGTPVPGEHSAPSNEPQAKTYPDMAAPSPETAKPAAPSETAKPAAPTTSPQAQPSAEEAKDWQVVPVFYGTDRAREPNPKRLSYNADQAKRLELGRALVTVPKIHEVPQIERPWAIRIPYFDVTIYEQAEDPNKHFTLQEIKSLTKADFLRLVRERLATSSAFKNHALVFVHGYDTSFDNALYRTAQIAYDLHFDGVPFVYSWPSGGAVTSYLYDRDSAEGAEPYLRQFLDIVVKETGAKTISVIAHSMGNKPLLDVLKDMKSAVPKGVVVSQIILAAPDVDINIFTNLAQQIKGLARGVTLYASANDRALLVSRSVWHHYRAGDIPATGPLIVKGIDTIDVTAASTDVFALNHSDYAQNTDLLTDIGKLIVTGLRPPDVRFNKLKPVNPGKNEYWRYVPGQPPAVETGTP